MGAFRACVAFVLLQGAFSYRLPSMTTRQIVASNVHAPSRTLSPKMIEFDSNTLAAVGALVLGLGGGVALIAFTENAGIDAHPFAQYQDASSSLWPTIVYVHRETQ